MKKKPIKGHGLSIRTIGFGMQELQAGPLTFLLSRSIPVAYRDARPEAMPPGAYRTDANFGKATTAHLNKWMGRPGEGRFAIVPHDLILKAFSHISRFQPEAIP